MINARFQAVQAAVGAAPKIVALMASDGVNIPRIFVGIGAPGVSTLPAGNGCYNGCRSGWVTSAALVNAGSGMVAGQVMNGEEGFQITVDSVGATGAIVDFHVSAIGNFSATTYPANPVAIGPTAIFALNFPPPDWYLDFTAPTAPVLYVCATAGGNATSTWQKISGSGGGGGGNVWL
jgi:hypothetical protein